MLNSHCLGWVTCGVSILCVFNPLNTTWTDTEAKEYTPNENESNPSNKYVDRRHFFHFWSPERQIKYVCVSVLGGEEGLFPSFAFVVTVNEICIILVVWKQSPSPPQRIIITSLTLMMLKSGDLTGKRELFQITRYKAQSPSEDRKGQVRDKGEV